MRASRNPHLGAATSLGAVAVYAPRLAAGDQFRSTPERTSKACRRAGVVASGNAPQGVKPGLGGVGASRGIIDLAIARTRHSHSHSRQRPAAAWGDRRLAGFGPLPVTRPAATSFASTEFLPRCWRMRPSPSGRGLVRVSALTGAPRTIFFFRQLASCRDQVLSTAGYIRQDVPQQAKSRSSNHLVCLRYDPNRSEEKTGYVPNVPGEFPKNAGASHVFVCR